MARVKVFPVVLLLVMVVSLLIATKLSQNVEAGHRLCSRHMGFCFPFRSCQMICKRAGYFRGSCQGHFRPQCICYKPCKP
ncbi:unnamed protein product [Spirodela intermedia]|uniref:Knottins-like domain-containing protein n=1 Tax=Spirodela intermedia TaxID=51605 RepID=A0A7I8LKH8_SPIIN|nr:unnamed protein product [Spirodela intermedia]